MPTLSAMSFRGTNPCTFRPHCPSRGTNPISTTPAPQSARNEPIASAPPTIIMRNSRNKAIPKRASPLSRNEPNELRFRMPRNEAITTSRRTDKEQTHRAVSPTTPPARNEPTELCHTTCQISRNEPTHYLRSSIYRSRLLALYSCRGRQSTEGMFKPSTCSPWATRSSRLGHRVPREKDYP